MFFTCPLRFPLYVLLPRGKMQEEDKHNIVARGPTSQMNYRQTVKYMDNIMIVAEGFETERTALGEKVCIRACFPCSREHHLLGGGIAGATVYGPFQTKTFCVRMLTKYQNICIFLYFSMLKKRNAPLQYGMTVFFFSLRVSYEYHADIFLVRAWFYIAVARSEVVEAMMIWRLYAFMALPGTYNCSPSFPRN